MSAQPLYYDESSPEPPLITFNRQIRQEAAEIYYLQNRFHVIVRDFHPRILLHLQRHLNAVFIGRGRFWRPVRHPSIHTQQHPRDSWNNLTFWLRLFSIGGVTVGFVYPQAMQENRIEERASYVVGGIFHLVQTLKGYPWSVVELLLDEQRHVLEHVINRANVHDQKLIPLASTPPTASSSSSSS